MTSNSLLPKLLPGLLCLSLAVLAFLLSFNGLYGQDAHEYLRQSRVIFDRWLGLPVQPLTLGDSEFAGGYPLSTALLRFLLGDAVWAMQVISWVAAAMAAWIMERLLDLLTPGVRAESRWAGVGLGMIFAPMFLRAGLSSMSDALGLAFVLAAFYFGLRAFENMRLKDLLFAAVFAAFALSTRYALAALLLPLALLLAGYFTLQKKWLALVVALCAFTLAMLPHFWLRGFEAGMPFGHSMLQHWSLENFFHRTFSNENGLSQYTLSNILFLAFPWMHPAFCLVLPGLFFLFKRTDLVLPEKKILLACIITYLILLGGLPHQNLRHLLPAYVLLLLVFFPAWDRLYCYGFLFFKRITAVVLAGALTIQVFFCIHYLAPVISRNRLELEVAAELKEILPPGAQVYAFDLDAAMGTYLPEVHFINLWERNYPDFPEGAYVLFNEELRTQWKDQNPILNWDRLNAAHRLILCKELPKGWRLWKIQ